MAPNIVKSRRVPPSDLDVPCRHNTRTVTVEDFDDEEEVDVNATKGNQNDENSDQMGQLLAMMKIM